MARHPELVGHRGDPLHEAENSLASFDSAIAKGAGAVEGDVRRTADGVWVVFHDRNLKRMTGARGSVSRSRWDRLRQLHIPRVSDLLSFCRKKGVTLYLDIKIPQGEKQLLSVLRRSGWLHRTVICASVPSSLKRWRTLLRAHPIFWVTGHRKRVTPRRVAMATSLKLTGFLSYKRWVTPAAVGRVHEAGLRIYLWTVRTPREIKRFASFGVDGMMSELWPPPSIS